MKNFEEIVPLIVAIIVAIVLFFGFITSVKKSLIFPKKRDTIDSTLKLKEQKRRMTNIQRRQRQAMRNQKQKIRDMRRQ